MTKYLVVFFALLATGTVSTAQSIRSNIEKALTDPKVAESSAKADALLINHKLVTTSYRYPGQVPATKKEKKRSFKRTKISPKGNNTNAGH